MKRIVLLLLLSLGYYSSFAQLRTSFIKDSLDNYVNAAMKQWQIPGAAVCVIYKGEVIAMKAYGVREMNKPERVDENTLFMIGSNTKAFTGTALATLEQEGKLHLDDHVQQWLPDFQLYDPWVAKEANIRDLLSHRLGFGTFQGDFMYYDSDLTSQEVREKLAKVKPLYGFRTRWGYTNAAFLTAGEIIPKACGLSWADFLRQRIFQPLQMNNTVVFTHEMEKVANKTIAHAVEDGKLQKIPYGNIDNLAPAGSISSSIKDMSHWVTMLLNNGKYEGKQVIPEDAIEATRDPHSFMGAAQHPTAGSYFVLYGLGWDVCTFGGHRIVGHTGGVNGFVTSVMLMPEEKTGIVVLTNTESNQLYEALTNELRDACLGMPYRDYSNNDFREYQEDEKEKAAQLVAIRKQIAAHPKLPLPLEAFTGEYQHEVYGKMNIKLENGTLIMRFEHHNGLEGKLEPISPKKFFCTYNRSTHGRKEIPFTIADNKVKSITVRVSGFVESNPYEFYKL